MHIQAHKFPDGSYVGHKVRVNEHVSKLTFSVWFTNEGMLTCVEGFDVRGHSRPVPDKARKVLATMYGWIVAASKQAPRAGGNTGDRN